MPRRLCEPLCIAFGTSVSSPTAPTYQLYDLPHKLKPRLYMEAREPWRVVREMKGWEQAATAEARSFLHDLLADRSAHDTFYVQLPVPGASNRCRLLQGIVVLTQKHPNGQSVRWPARSKFRTWCGSSSPLARACSGCQCPVSGSCAKRQRGGAHSASPGRPAALAAAGRRG